MAKAQAAVDVNDQLQEELQKANLGDMVRAIDEVPDNDVKCVSTGLPSLDKILHKEKLGLPRGRDIEIHSDDSEAGKTSLALKIGSSYQKLGYRVAICDIANTITTPYMASRGFYTDRTTTPAGIYLPSWVQTDDSDGVVKPAEEILNNLTELVHIMDLIILDDAPCLIQAGDLEKDADENTKTGGIAKPLTEHMRRTSHKRASMIWINQRREKIGRTMPGMPAKKKSMGGEAIPFWSSIRVTLTRIAKMESGSDDKKDSYGMKVKAYTEKNKVSPPFKTAILTYLDDEGFSDRWDYFEMGVKAGIITKKGSRYTFEDHQNVNGELTFYKELREDAGAFESLKEKIDAQLNLQ